MASGLRDEDLLSEVLQLLNGFKNVIKGKMGPLLRESGNIGVPSLAQFLDRRDIDHSVVEEIQQFWHFLGEELPVVPNAVAAKRGFVFIHPFSEESEGGLFGFSCADALLADSVHQATAVVVGGVPFVHAIDEGFWNTDGKVWTCGEDIQLTVGDDGGDFDDRFS